MTKAEYAHYTQSGHWQQRRKKAIADAYHKCERCELPRWVARLIYDQDLHVHHLNYQHLGKEQYEDLETLCRRCHEIETFGRTDYKEIKKATCSICKSAHWNIYSDYCDLCRSILEREGEDPLYYKFQNNDEDGSPLWLAMICDAVRFGEIPIDGLLIALAAVTLRRDEDLKHLTRAEALGEPPF